MTIPGTKFSGLDQLLEGDLSLLDDYGGVLDTSDTSNPTGKLKIIQELNRARAYSVLTQNNILINPYFTVNQRKAASKTETADDYNFDRWYYKVSTSKLVQVVAEGNYTPSVIHTLSGGGIPTEQITSPSSGNWEISIPTTATSAQLNEGNFIATCLKRSVEEETALCKKYFERKNKANGFTYMGWGFIGNPTSTQYINIVYEDKISNDIVFSLSSDWRISATSVGDKTVTNIMSSGNITASGGVIKVYTAVGGTSLEWCVLATEDSGDIYMDISAELYPV